MDTAEDFGRALEWRAALRRLQEREPELCEDFDALAEECDLFGHDDPRAGVEATKRALATEHGREVIGRFRALLQIQREIGTELRGAPASLDRRPISDPQPRLRQLEDHSGMPERPLVEEPSEASSKDRGEEKPEPPPPPSLGLAEPVPPPFVGLRRGTPGWRSM